MQKAIQVKCRVGDGPEQKFSVESKTGPGAPKDENSSRFGRILGRSSDQSSAQSSKSASDKEANGRSTRQWMMSKLPKIRNPMSKPDAGAKDVTDAVSPTVSPMLPGDGGQKKDVPAEDVPAPTKDVPAHTKDVPAPTKDVPGPTEDLIDMASFSDGKQIKDDPGSPQSFGDGVVPVGGARTKGRRTNKNKSRSRKHKKTSVRRKKRIGTFKRRRRKTKKNIRTRRHTR
jgi:hypothetical protein